jgi:4-amino-4-deoxy-L-arabinose transferase-like glycosyltransferase
LRLPALRLNLATFICLLALTVLLQFASGAYHSEFGSYPDEPAHYVTSLMVREYLKAPDLLHPMRFAENYYSHYPKVAFGHWPPVFYVVQSVWMLLFSASRVSIRLEIAFTTALLAFSLYYEAKRFFGVTAARLGALLLVCLPLVQSCTDQEMSETLLTLFCFWSAVFFARYIESERRKDSVWFGVFLSFAVLTKGNGWLLCLIPPVALLLTRRLVLLLRPAFWISVLIVAALCLPWQIMTMSLASEGWASSSPSMHYTLNALGAFTLIIVQITGWALFVLVALGIIVQVLQPLLRRRPVTPLPAVMLALILATWIFHSLVPAGVEDRKMIIAAPALVLFLIAGGLWLADRLPLRGRGATWRRGLVAVGAGVLFATGTFAIPHDPHYGYVEAAQFIHSHPEFRGAAILSSSNSTGEGLLVSEVAMLDPHPDVTIVRATKALARMNWDGSSYQSLVFSPADVLAALSRERIQFVVIDGRPFDKQFLHNKVLLQAIASNPAHFQLLATYSGDDPSATIRIFSFRP